MKSIYAIELEGKWYDIRRMNGDQLEELEMLLQNDIALIRDQIESAQANHWTTGDYADPDWWRRARTAKAIKARQLEMVKRLRKAKKAEERNASGAGLSSCFMDAARAVLPPETFHLVLETAKNIQASRGMGK